MKKSTAARPSLRDRRSERRDREVALSTQSALAGVTVRYEKLHCTAELMHQ